MPDEVKTPIRDLRTGARYWRLGPNRVRVEARDGNWGVFDAAARWIEGPLRSSDLHMCIWVGGLHACQNMSILSGRAVSAEPACEEEDPSGSVC